MSLIPFEDAILFVEPKTIMAVYPYAQVSAWLETDTHIDLPTELKTWFLSEDMKQAHATGRLTAIPSCRQVHLPGAAYAALLANWINHGLQIKWPANALAATQVLPHLLSEKTVPFLMRHANQLDYSEIQPQDRRFKAVRENLSIYHALGIPTFDGFSEQAFVRKARSAVTLESYDRDRKVISLSRIEQRLYDYFWSVFSAPQGRALNEIYLADVVAIAYEMERIFRNMEDPVLQQVYHHINTTLPPYAEDETLQNAVVWQDYLDQQIQYLKTLPHARCDEDGYPNELDAVIVVLRYWYSTLYSHWVYASPLASNLLDRICGGECALVHLVTADQRKLCDMDFPNIVFNGINREQMTVAAATYGDKFLYYLMQATIVHGPAEAEFNQFSTEAAIYHELVNNVQSDVFKESIRECVKQADQTYLENNTMPCSENDYIVSELKKLLLEHGITFQVPSPATIPTLTDFTL